MLWEVLRGDFMEESLMNGQAVGKDSVKGRVCRSSSNV